MSCLPCLERAFVTDLRMAVLTHPMADMQGQDWSPYVVEDLDGPVKLITGQNPQVRSVI